MLSIFQIRDYGRQRSLTKPFVKNNGTSLQKRAKVVVNVLKPRSGTFTKALLG